MPSPTVEPYLTDVWITAVKWLSARDFAPGEDPCVTCRNRLPLYSFGPSKTPAFFATTSLHQDLGKQSFEGSSVYD